MDERGPTAMPESLCVPLEDEAIERAFADVDEKLAVWATAMQDAQSALQEALATCVAEMSRDDEGLSGDAVLAGDATPPSRPGSTTEVDRVETEDVAKPDELESDAAGLPDPVDSEPETTPPVEAREEQPKPTPPHVEQPAHDGQESPPQAEDSDNEDEDEALLASLDEETARSIRVMRRLNPDGKSVRELLEEYQSTQGGGGDRNEKKSWWKRLR